jgi:tRNA-Thr(GGU) m(6)t(6)A37 methyltransferase TsaA
MKQQFVYCPIGTIRSPFKEVKGTPIQPCAAEGVPGEVVVDPEYAAGLKDLDGFSHIILFYHFHESKGFSLEVTPFLDDQPRGLFATRAPKRPNAIGVSVVRLTKVEGNVLHILDVDILDGTPLLDIKPYVPKCDARQTDRIGWFAKNVGSIDEARADERFSDHSS